MGADADALCGADYGERSAERVNRRNGYRERAWDTRAGTIALQVPKLREGTYFPEWLLEPRRRAERAFVQVVAECYVRGVSTRRVEGLVASARDRADLELPRLGDGQGARRRRRGLPHPTARRWPLHLRVAGRAHPEGPRRWEDRSNRGRVVATGVNATGYREILGLDLVHDRGRGRLDSPSCDRLVARGLSGRAPGDLRCPSGAHRRDRLDAAGSLVATMQDPFPPQPPGQGAQVGRPVRRDARALDLRPARRTRPCGRSSIGWSSNSPSGSRMRPRCSPTRVHDIFAFTTFPQTHWKQTGPGNGLEPRPCSRQRSANDPDLPAVMMSIDASRQLRLGVLEPIHRVLTARHRRLRVAQV